jgi:hypothetical protein
MKQNNDKKRDKKEKCSEHIINTLKRANIALNYADFGAKFAYGTLRNEMGKQVNHGAVLTLPNECPGRYILLQWVHRPEYSCAIRIYSRGRVGKFDFLSYLESLPWGKFLCVHDLRLCFMVYHLSWLGEGWQYCKESRSYSRRFELSYPVSVQCFDSGTVLVSISCSVSPFPLDLNGLGALLGLLGELRNVLHAPNIPDPNNWLVVQWHLNRDTEELQGGGIDVYLTFKDFFDDSAQFYHKRELDRMRAEVIQSPNRTIQQVFENILTREATPNEEMRRNAQGSGN